MERDLTLGFKVNLVNETLLTLPSILLVKVLSHT